MKKQWISILIVAMTLGTAWAIRGQFGHEQGAAWAGGIGALALVLVSKRKDWYSKVLTVAFAAAVGWGAGGMISYGQVVGYGRSDNFPNAFYGLLMLFVIGSLYGLLGGGLVGLSLDSSTEKKVKWGSLISEMIAGGVLIYYLLIGQLEWLMTPPRSEAWAVCLGAGFAMLWHMARNNNIAALRVAFYSAMGAGFGFAFGNFLHTLGTVWEIHFNMWNVMEYSIGFFGGTGMAYGVFSSVWPDSAPAPQRWETKISMLAVFVFVPFVIFFDAMGYETLMKRINAAINHETVALLSTALGGLIIFAVAIIGYLRFLKVKVSFGKKDVMLLFLVYFAAYISVSYIVSGFFAGVFPLNHHLYWVNFIIILLLVRKQSPAFFENKISTIHSNRWFLYFVCLIILVLLLSIISTNISEGINGCQNRFPNH